MIGDFSVGKTSLVNKFVRETYSDKYLTTVGVKIDTKLLDLPDGNKLKFILWDIAGSASLTTTTVSYLRGAAGFLLVVDGTRRPTWDSALNLREEVQKQIGDKPFVILLNKADLKDQWEMDRELLEGKVKQGWKLLATSAKNGMNIEKAFLKLALLMTDQK
ncbi:MAG: GTP-binding protein [Proteobacteria bacterium]|nr:GTP-binding protein [Pseudomonadota bacterium]